MTAFKSDQQRALLAEARLRGNIFNVLDYGADPTGVAGSGAAFAAAAAAAGNHGSIYAPQPTAGVQAAYLVDAPVAMGLHTNLVGDGADSVHLQTQTGSSNAFTWLGTGSPEAAWARFVRVSGLGFYHTGSGAPIHIEKATSVYLDRLFVKGVSATGNAIELVDSYFIILKLVRPQDFSGAGFYVHATGAVQPGQITWEVCQAARNQDNWNIQSDSNIIDSLTWQTCVSTNPTRSGFRVTGNGGNRNYKWINTHIDDTSSTSNTSVGLYQSGNDAVNWGIDGLFVNGPQTPIQLNGFVTGIDIDRVQLLSHSHASPAAQAITTNSNVSGYRLGNVKNANGYPAIDDQLSDSATRRRVFSGTFPTNHQCSADVTVTSGLADVTDASATATPTYPEVWTVIATFDVDVTVAGTGFAVGIIDLDGVTQSGSARVDMRFTERANSVVVSTFSVTADVHTVKLRINKSVNDGTATAKQTNSRFLLFRSPA